MNILALLAGAAGASYGAHLYTHTVSHPDLFGMKAGLLRTVVGVLLIFTGVFTAIGAAAELVEEVQYGG